MESQQEGGSIHTPPKFNTKMRLYWGIASFGSSIISGIYASLLPIFYTDYLGLVSSAYLITLVSILYAIWNALNDPIFGFISDSTKGKRGRRIPYMRYTAPFLGLTFVLVWFAPKSTDVAIFWWMLITMLLYDTAYTIVGIVYSALLPEVSEDEGQRNGLQVFASFFSLLGTIFGFLIPDFFRNQPGGSFFPLQMAMIAVGILGAACILFTTYKFKERPEFTQLDKPLPIIPSIKYTFKSKSFLILTSANFMSILMQSLILGSMFYLADYITQTPTIMLLVAIFIPLILGIWITGKLIKYMDVVRANQLLLIIGGTGLISITFIPAELIYLSLVLAGIGLVGPLVYTNVLFAQVADEDELKTGVRREAAFFGINALITKPAQSVALAVPAALLAAAKFIPRIETGGVVRPDLQPVAVFFAIRVFIGLIPGIALLVGAVILQFYPLKGKTLKEMKIKILEIHAEKHAKYEQMAKKRVPDQNQQ